MDLRRQNEQSRRLMKERRGHAAICGHGLHEVLTHGTIHRGCALHASGCATASAKRPTCATVHLSQKGQHQHRRVTVDLQGRGRTFLPLALHECRFVVIL